MANEQINNETKVAIVVVTYNALDFVKICLQSIKKYTTVPYELIVVDNASGEDLKDYLKEFSPEKLILSEKNQLWAAGCNQGIEAISDDVTHVMLLNSDMEVRRADWLQRMLNVMESDDRIGIIGTAQARVRIFPTFGSVDGQCMMVRRHLFDQIGLLNSEKYPWNGGDVDFTARAFKRGYIYKIMPPDPELTVHYRGMSRRKKRIEQIENKKDYDRLAAIRQAGLRAFWMPRFVFEIYKRLPGRPFYELTRKEHRIARGKE